MFRRVLVLVAAGALVACDTPTVQSPQMRAPQMRAPQAPSRTTVPNQEAWIPEHFTIFNPCNSDLVPVTGTLHVSMMTDPSGVTSIHANGTNLTGVAPDGTSYEFIRVSRAEVQSNPLDEMYTAEYRVVSLGSEPNFLLDFTAHIYEDAQGGFHADFLKLSARCVG